MVPSTQICRFDVAAGEPAVSENLPPSQAADLSYPRLMLLFQQDNFLGKGETFAAQPANVDAV